MIGYRLLFYKIIKFTILSNKRVYMLGIRMNLYNRSYLNRFHMQNSSPHHLHS